MWRMFKFLGFRIEAKVYDVGSDFGIKEIPRISKLNVRFGDSWLLNYDRGWDFNNLPNWAYKALIKFLDSVI